jgi:hypothetical protein
MSKAKRLARITVTRVESEYQFQLDDEAGKTVRVTATSEQVVELADALDDLLAEEEGTQQA